MLVAAPYELSYIDIEVALANRPFRSAESLRLEAQARDFIKPFLESRGVVVLQDRRRTTGTATAHSVSAQLSSGELVLIKVKLCWNRNRRIATEMRYSATQLQARRLSSGWDDTLVQFVERNRELGITHLLIAQPEAEGISLAALLPLEQVPRIWWEQHDVSDELIRNRALGRQTKNHAANGHSPTLWLQDDRTENGRLVADVLWNCPGVIDLTAPSSVSVGSIDDTFDDCPGMPPQGHDGAERRTGTRSYVPRSPKVREAVRCRAKGACERCGESRSYAVFLDIHHVRGVEKSDQVWTCVAICPNCHREAHFSPEAKSINNALAQFAAQFEPNERVGKKRSDSISD